MIKNIVFDFGGVILTDDDAGVLFDNSEFYAKFPYDKETLQSAWTKYWKEVGEGRMTIIDFYNSLQKELLGSFNEEFSQKLWEIYKDKTHSLEAFSIVSILKDKYKLFALTNIFKEGLEFKIDKYNLNNLFLKIIASCDFGISKPEPEFFKILLKEVNINPEETLFVDDRLKNIDAAKKLGFQTFHYKELNELKKEFDLLGIRYE